MYEDRIEAGRALGPPLAHLKADQCVVLGIPRGGVPVANEVARSLDAPLDVVIVRKLGVPSQPELAFGAVGPEGARVLNEGIIAAFGLTQADVDRVAARESQEQARREAMFRSGAQGASIKGKTAIIVDDGLATGATALAAIRAVRLLWPARIVLAVPVAAPETLARLALEVDEVVCPLQPENLRAIGLWYRHFDPTPDEDVIALLRGARERDQSAATVEREVIVTAGAARIRGILAIPQGAPGIVLFVHGSGSGRLSPRNQWVARKFQEAGLATLLIDLLTTEEAVEDEQTARLRFDIDLLAERVKGASAWLRQAPLTQALPVGYFGSSTGAAAALVAAADATDPVRAIVSRGGRPDLAGEALEHVVAPTLLLVGGHDHEVIRLNHEALERLRCEKAIEIVPGATHLFEEPGTLEQVAQEAAGWFRQHLPMREPSRQQPAREAV